MSASSYLPGRSSSEYCHRYESLRPCSRWERVVSSRFDTDETCQFTEYCIEIVIILFVSFYRLWLLRKSKISTSPSLCSVFQNLALVLRVAKQLCFTRQVFYKLHTGFARKSPRPISNARLHMLPYFYLHPIYLVICKGTY